MSVSLEKARAGIIRHYKGRGWSEEQIRADDLRPEEIFRIYRCCQKDEEVSKQIIHEFAGLLNSELPASGE